MTKSSRLRTEMSLKKFSVTWTHRDTAETGRFACEAKTSQRAMSKCFAELRTKGVVVCPMEIFRIDLVIEERL